MISQVSRLALVVAAAGSLSGAAHAQQAIGTAGAANTRTTGTPPGKGTRTIEIGTQVVHNEKIETSATGSLHVIFIDKTTLNVGPNSTLVINEFVYNPATGTGRMAATLAKGVMRIVGGQVTHTGGAEVKTPAATIGVRGGVATIRHCASAGAGCQQAGTRAINHFGVLTAQSGGGTETISRPGFGTFISGLNIPPVSPTRVSQTEINLNNGQLSSQGGARGGVNRPPSDQQAQRGGVGQANSNANPLNIIPLQQQNTSGQQNRLPANPQTAQNTLQQGAQQAATTSAAEIVQSTVVNSARSFVMTTTAGAGSGVPFLAASIVGAGRFNISPIYGFKPENSSFSHVLQASLNINGSGANQTSTLALATGMTGKLENATGYLMGGGFDATSSLDSRREPSSARGNFSSTTQDGALSFVPTDASGVPNGSFALTQNAIDASSSKLIEIKRHPATISGQPVTPYTFTQTVSPQSSTTAATRETRTLTGFAGGLIGGAGDFVIASSALSAPNAVSITGYANGNLGATFNQKVFIPDYDGKPYQFDFVDLDFRFGAHTENADTGRGAYIDSRIFGARAQVGEGAPTSTINLTYDGQTTRLSPTDDHFFMVSSDAVNAASFFPGVNFCVCDFTRWGFWSANAGFTDPSDPQNTATLPGHMMTWVAGIAAKQIDMPTTGTATYNGHVIATMANGSAQYLAAANMTGQVNFGTGSIGMSVSNLDGFNYGGTKLANGAVPTTFQMQLAGSAASGTTPVNPTMYLNGGFFTSASSPVGSMAGAAIISAPANQNYFGSGIFALQK